MTGIDPGFRALQGQIDELSSAPMSKALEKSDLWRTRLKGAVSAYKVPSTTREDANLIFDSENAEHRMIHGFSQPAERMLQTKYHIFSHSATQTQVVRCLDYSIPMELKHHVDLEVESGQP